MQIIGKRPFSVPRVLRTDTVAPALVRPSMNTCAVTLNASPSSTRAGYRPFSADGVMSRTFTRPNCSGLVRLMIGAGVSPTVRFVAVFGLEVRLVVGFLVVVFAVDFAAVLVVFVAAALAVVFAVAFVRGVALDDVASFI